MLIGSVGNFRRRLLAGFVFQRTAAAIDAISLALAPHPAARLCCASSGCRSAISIVIGTVIGSGIFLVPSAMIRNVGSVRNAVRRLDRGRPAEPVRRAHLCRTGRRDARGGGEYVYLSAAYGPFWGFLYGWTQFWVAKSGSIATLAAGFYTYLTVFLPALGASLLVMPLHIGPGGSLLEIHYGQLVAIALILVLGGVNYVGVRPAAACRCSSPS